MGDGHSIDYHRDQPAGPVLAGDHCGVGEDLDASRRWFVTVELVHDGNPVDRGTDLSHFVVQVESMADTLDLLAGHGIGPVAPVQRHDDGMKTALITDPDGRRIELVQWPAGHSDGMTAADWAVKGE